MAFCSSCGTLVEGQFCPKCGTPAAGTPDSNFTQPPSSGSIQPGISINGASALCYLFGFITGIVFLVLAPYNQDRRVRFHAFQSIFLNIAIVLIHMGIIALTLMLHAVSFALGVMVSSLHLLVSMAFFILWLFMMWKSSQGETIVLPIVGPLAERQARGQDSSSGTIGRAA